MDEDAMLHLMPESRLSVILVLFYVEYSSVLTFVHSKIMIMVCLAKLFLRTEMLSYFQFSDQSQLTIHGQPKSDFIVMWQWICILRF